MVICRTPLRISFFGGGTDYPVWYKKHGGAVISASINKYNYITARWLPPYFDYKYRIRYYQQEQTTTIDEIKHPSVRECARYLNIQDGIEIVHNADVPAQSGLGSSSAFTVGMLHALHTLQNRMPTRRQLAIEAIHVEQDLIGEVVGSQDQTAAAFGGFNHIKFNKTGEIDVDPIIIPRERLQNLQSNLVLVFTGFTRTASKIAEAQISVVAEKSKELKALDQLCGKALDIIVNDEISLDNFAQLLNDQWIIKRSLTEEISNPVIDDIYQSGIGAGALGGKLLGAGGGGFMLFYVPYNRQESFETAMNRHTIIKFRFDFTGSKVVYYSND